MISSPPFAFSPSSLPHDGVVRLGEGKGASFSSNAPLAMVPPYTASEVSQSWLVEGGLAPRPGARVQGEGGQGEGRAREARPSLPCLTINNSTGTELAASEVQGPIYAENDEDLVGRRCVTTYKGEVWRIPSVHHAKTAYILEVEIREMVRRHGIEKIGFLTLTFKDHVTDGREAQKRYNSLATHFLRPRYGEFAKVSERTSSGRWHYHLVIATPNDIRTGFNWAEVDDKALAKNVRYKSASKWLRAEWAVLRRTMPKFGFGPWVQLCPIKSTQDAIARYLGGYIAKCVHMRRERDKGLRLVAYSMEARKTSLAFSWSKRGMDKWRMCLAAWAASVGISDYSDLKTKLGPKWAWHNRETIITFLDAPQARQDARREVGAPEAKEYALERASVFTPRPGLGLKVPLSHLEALSR